MALVDYLCEDTVCMELQGQERDEAIHALLERVVDGQLMSGGLVGKAMSKIVDRERLGSTAIGKGVAVPHARLDGLQKVVVAFGYSTPGIEFNALDGELVHEVFLVVAPNDHTDEYIGIMQSITRLVQDPDFRRFVAQSSNAEEVIELVAEMDS